MSGWRSTDNRRDKFIRAMESDYPHFLSVRLSSVRVLQCSSHESELRGHREAGRFDRITGDSIGQVRVSGGSRRSTVMSGTPRSAVRFGLQLVGRSSFGGPFEISNAARGSAGHSESSKKCCGNSDVGTSAWSQGCA